MIFDRLAIGTANWGKEYNGVKVPEDEQKRILDYCREVGINMIDTATAYGWDWTKVGLYFKVVVKVQTQKDLDEMGEWPCCLMAHGIDAYNQLNIPNVSIYEPLDVSQFDFYKCNIVQVPYSIFDRRFEGCFEEFKRCNIEIHVRSVFLRGKILVQFEPHECISFCLMNPYVDRVILGADSFEQFKDNLELLEEMCDSQKTDENILDPRKWKD